MKDIPCPRLIPTRTVTHSGPIALPLGVYWPAWSCRFCEGLSLCSRAHSFSKDGQDFKVFCFADRLDAELSQERFGGRIVLRKIVRSGSRIPPGTRLPMCPGTGTIPKRLTFREKPLRRQTMADDLGPLSDKTPRDPSKMGSSSHTSLYAGLLLAAIVIGFACTGSHSVFGTQRRRTRRR